MANISIATFLRSISTRMKSSHDENIRRAPTKARVLDREIAETKKRLPAHSVKPPVMMDLLALEDEYDAVLKQIERLKKEDPEA